MTNLKIASHKSLMRTRLPCLKVFKLDKAIIFLIYAMYYIIKSVINKNFNALSNGDYEILLDTYLIMFSIHFYSNSAIGGQRKSKDKLRLWFKRFIGISNVGV